MKKLLLIFLISNVSLIAPLKDFFNKFSRKTDSAQIPPVQINSYLREFSSSNSDNESILDESEAEGILLKSPSIETLPSSYLSNFDLLPKAAILSQNQTFILKIENLNNHQTKMFCKIFYYLNQIIHSSFFHYIGNNIKLINQTGVNDRNNILQTFDNAVQLFFREKKYTKALLEIINIFEVLLPYFEIDIEPITDIMKTKAWLKQKPNQDFLSEILSFKIKSILDILAKPNFVQEAIINNQQNAEVYEVLENFLNNFAENRFWRSFLGLDRFEILRKLLESNLSLLKKTVFRICNSKEATFSIINQIFCFLPKEELNPFLNKAKELKLSPFYDEDQLLNLSSFLQEAHNLVPINRNYNILLI